MILGAPIYLFGLAALLVPVMIHLWSKNTKNNVAFGSICFLKETVTKTTRHFFPSDLLLLLLRCLIFILLVLILSDPFVFTEKVGKTAFLIDPALQSDLERIKASIPENADIFWLSDLKTPVDDSLKDLRRNLWLTYSAFTAYDSLVVFSPGNLAGFHGKRPKVDRTVQWIIPPVNEVNQAVTTIRKNEKRYEIIENSDAAGTFFEIQETASGGEVISVPVFLHSSERYKRLSDRTRSALLAIAGNGLVNLEIKPYDRDKITRDAWVIWLDDETPEWRKNLIYVQGSQGELVRKVSEGIFTISKNADTDAMLRENFPLQLERALHETLTGELDVKDPRVLPESQLQASFREKSGVQEASAMSPAKASLARIGWVLLVLFVLIERTFSNIKTRK